ncbi:hypothetical protein BK011_06650 [Tenericutes bacterium MZ-XQ]|nr:hypothetical protein BK011_06650 [Tenericutes bacterium MZ-XQ]
MKEIHIKCFDGGYATLTQESFTVDNENNATKLYIDYSETIHKDNNKWVDLIMADGTSLRYDLGLEQIPTLDLTYAMTIPGYMIISPLIYDGDIKEKYVTNFKVRVHEQPEAGSSESINRDDFIFSLKQQVDTWDAKHKYITQLLEGETIDYSLISNNPIVVFQVRDVTTGRTEVMQYFIRTEINSMFIEREIERSPLKLAKIELTNNVITFDVVNELGLSDRIGAVLDIYTIYLREEL